jgi:6-phosphogluconolactonase
MERGSVRIRLLLALAAGIGAAFVGAPGALADVTPRAVYTETNTVPMNFVVVYSRAADGTLTETQSVPTGGSGVTSSPPFGFPVTDSQGAVMVSPDRRFLFAVNAGSDTVSSFSLGPHGIALVDQAPSGGDNPISIAVNQRGVMYVLNTLSDSIAGLRVSPGGSLTPIAGSIRTFGSGAIPAQVGFNPTGDVLAVTEQESNQISTWVVAPDGTPGPTVTNASTGNVPFGFAFNATGDLFATNADIPASSASTYEVDRTTGVLTPIDFAPALTLSACWAVITNSNRYAFTSSPLDQAISSFRINPDGTIVLLDPQAGTTTGLALDEALSPDSKFLYVVNPADLMFTSSGIDIFAVNVDGTLTPVGSVGGLPGGTSGLAAT